ncbi:hypothetical protein JCM5353_005938, partial [Sporobolomyces roseus]
AGQHHRAASTTTVKINLAPSGMAVAAAECEKSASQKRRLSPRELRYAPVLTIVGIKIQCPLEWFIPLGNLVDAGVLIRDRMDAVNLVFRDEATRKKAFWTLEGKPARKFLDECAQYDMYYVAWRPTADIAFHQLEPLDQPVFDEKRRIYLQDEFKPSGWDFGPTGSIELPPPPSNVAHDPTLMEITSISAFFASEFHHRLTGS